MKRQNGIGFIILLLLSLTASGAALEAESEVEMLLRFRQELVQTLDQLNPDRFMNAQELNLLNELYSEQSPVYSQVLQDTDEISKLLNKKKLTEVEELIILKNATLDSLAIDQITAFYLPLEKTGMFRRLLNEEDAGYEKLKNSFRKLLKLAYSAKVWKNINQAQSLVAKFEKSDDAETLKLISLFKNSSSIKGRFIFRVGVGERAIVDGFIKGLRGTFYGLSKFFGNIVGRFESRKGYLWEDAALENNLAESLQPLDVLLEKTPFRATDRFIPGHWGHAAIYVGNKSQLMELGLWEHPEVIPHQKNIEAGAVIVEALRPGVQINSIAHFLNIDDLAVQRYNRELSVEEKKEYLIRTFKQIGKKYDFAFDAESGKTIVCSELPYMIFKDVNFNIAVALGRPNITPDHISAKSIGANADFDLILFIHDGKIVTEKPAELLGTLLKE